MTLKDFHYVIAGRSGAPWMIFLHGLLGSVANWRRIGTAFESDYSLLTFDQRGHGKSFKPAGGYAPEDFASDILFLMDQFGILKATLIGHSMGGRNAISFAQKNPQRVEKLIIEDIGPAASLRNGFELVSKLKAVPVPFSDKKTAKEYFLNEFHDPRLGNFLYMSIILNESGQGVWNFDLKNVIEIIEKGRGADRWDEWENLKCPTLVIRGANSTELEEEEFQRMKASNPHVEGVEIGDAGHWVHFERPVEFIQAVRQFLSV